MIKVSKMGKEYALEITEGEEKIILHFKQLNYFDRNKVGTLSTSFSEGRVMLDVGLACFYNLKYGLKRVEGLANEDESPYVLEFEKGTEHLTDATVDELLACPLSDKLIYAAKDLGNNIPDVILDPVTNEPVKGIKVIKEKGGLEKKL